MLEELKKIFTELSDKWDIDLIEFGGEADHVHLLIEVHPNVMPSTMINNFKTVSSRYLRRDFSDHLKKFYWKKPVLWTRAYCLLSAGGAPLETIKKYIENQGRNSSPPKHGSLEDSP